LHHLLPAAIRTGRLPALSDKSYGRLGQDFSLFLPDSVPAEHPSVNVARDTDPADRRRYRQGEDMMSADQVKDDNPADILDPGTGATWFSFMPGIDYRVLRTSAETGVWTVIFRCAKGTAFAPHYHYGAGEYLMLKGSMDYRAGTAKAGDYGYEPLGVYHESTAFTEDSELLFTNHGPVAFVNPDKSILMMLDWKFFADKQAEAMRGCAA
jgi:anti-sigma factor ChrR (cupin superfamily)